MEGWEVDAKHRLSRATGAFPATNWAEEGLEHGREDMFWFRQRSYGLKGCGAGGRGHHGCRECTGVKAVRGGQRPVGDGVTIRRRAQLVEGTAEQGAWDLWMDLENRQAWENGWLCVEPTQGR